MLNILKLGVEVSVYNPSTWGQEDQKSKGHVIKKKDKTNKKEREQIQRLLRF